MHTVQIAGCYYPKPLPQVFTQSRLILKEAASTIAKRTSTPVVECDEEATYDFIAGRGKLLMKDKLVDGLMIRLNN
jgi:hypothetical protein